MVIGKLTRSAAYFAPVTKTTFPVRSGRLPSGVNDGEKGNINDGGGSGASGSNTP